ncbi:unnamed protein product [Pieris macdunnoughi]|uniref:V-type proton ATPase subunit D n=1 Tax=Pieris macdunnoughi TaxID=345717 RepID=A0A821KZ20_9NEOP|nr:unnamed protein product [Pieris macdunnoughi]
MKDDDEDEENTFGVTRYPCMPSLVALQQMRNRLHLAFLGRKLMKWTMTATGREMRRIAGEIDAIYKGFDADLRNAYILLARSRYFDPTLNQMVLENIPTKAAVMVVPTAKAVSGVKLMNYAIIETNAQCYVHLGLEKGGQTILETKKAWLELLKRLISMLQLRTSFMTVEISNRAATKKMNVLGKIVIPKTNVTMGYINNELEELAREEFFRLKKVLDIKRKLKEAKEDKVEKKTVEDKPTKRKPKVTPPEEIEEGKCIICGGIIQELTEEEKEAQAEKLEELKAQIKEIMDMTKGLNQEGILRTNVNEFLRTAEELKEKIDDDSLDFELISLDLNLEEMCEECRIKYLDQHKKVKIMETLIEDPLPEETDVPSSDLSQLNGITIKEPSKETVKSTKPPEAETPREPSSRSVKSLPQPETPGYSGVESDMELGTFETEEKEIIKIKRIRNEDGTYSEQKKVIKIKREVKTPAKTKSTASNGAPSSTSSGKPPFSGSKTIGMVEVHTKALNAFDKVENALPIIYTQSSESLKRIFSSSVTLLSSNSDQFVAKIKNSNKISRKTYVTSALSNSEEELLLQIKDRPCNVASSLENIKPRYKINKSISYYY